MNVLRVGSAHKERQALWAPIYADVLEILNGIANNHTLVPMGDDYHGKLNATTFTGRSSHASGHEPIWTPNQSLSAMGVEYVGPGRIPGITFNGTSDEIITPDAAKWSTAGPITIGAWIKLVDATSSVILSKYDGSNVNEWYMRMTGGDDLGFTINDADSNNHITALTDVALTSREGQWMFVTSTFDGGTSEDNILAYIDGVRVAETGSTAGTFVNSEDTAAEVQIGSQNATPTNFFDGVIAGGPLGIFFVTGEATPEEIQRLYQIGRAALLGV